MYADVGDIDVPNLYDGIPIDGETLFWEYGSNGNKVLKSKSGTIKNVHVSGNGNALSSVSLTEDNTALSFLKSYTFATEGDLSRTKGELLTLIDTKADQTYVDETFVTFKNDEDIEGIKNFLNGIKINGHVVKQYDNYDDAIYIDTNLVVRGGITMYAEGDVDIPSILDSLPIASTTSKGIASFDSSYFNVDSDGKVTLLAENVGLNETELFDYLSRNDYAKKSDIPSLSGYATETYVEDRLDDLINGAPAAYDTLKEIADVLAGNVDSIGDIITTLGTKADKAIKISAGTGLSGGGTLEADRTLSLATSGVTAGTYKSVTVDNYGRVTSGTNPTTLAGYGITDAYTKTKVDELLSLYVTLAGTQTITGEKNFTGGLKVNGSPIVYDATNKYWRLEGDLLVTGGVTMYATDTVDVPSIIDSLPIASTSAKGLASFDPNFFSVDDNGNVSFIGSTGITEVNWTDVVGRPTLLSSFINDQGFASTLGELANVGSWADSAPTQGRFLYQEAGSSEWSYKNISEFISQTGAYLPLSGGSLEGSTGNILKITSTYVTTNGWHTPLSAYTPNMPSQAHANIEVGKSSSARNLAWFGFKYDSDGSYNNLLTIGMHSVDDALVINGYGYVGVGTLSPTTALDIYDGDVTANAYRVGRWNNSKEDNMTNQLDYTISYLRTTNQVCGRNTLQHIIGWANTLNGTSETRYTIGSWRGADGYGKMIFNVLSPNNRLLELGLNGKTGYLQLTGSSEFGQYNQNMHHLFYGIGTGDGYYSVVELVSPNEVSISYGDNQRYSDPYRWSVGRAGVGSSARFQFWNAVSNTAVVQIFTSGDFLTTGGITMYSDIRKKTKLQDVELSLKQIADAPLIEHYYNSDSNKTTHVGSIAQYWASMNDWFCKLDSEGFYTMEIQNAALASAISIARELSRYETKTDRKIRLLKQRVKELEDKIEKLENN